MVSHAVGSVVKGVTDLVVVAGGRTLIAVEVLSGMYTVSLSKDQLKFSDDTARVELEYAETGKRFSSARDEFKGSLETKP